MQSNVIAALSIIVSGLLGTGGAGYALIQWFVKRNDAESQANAARVLTHAAASMVVELRSEKNQVLQDLRDVRSRVDSLRQAVLKLIRVIGTMDMPPNGRGQALRDALLDVEKHL